jgi:hypothetical protein
MTTKPILCLTALLIAWGATSAEAAVLCARRRADGTFNGGVAIREVCTSRETQVDAATLGLQAPTLASLDGLACDTGSPDKPDGVIVASVDAATGVTTLRCLSTSTSPVLTVMLGAGPQICSSVLGFPSVCFLTRFAVQEVDSNGTPIPSGFTCDPGAPSLSPFPIVCETQRFARGATVRLRALGGSGLTPLWSGCDAADGDICIVSLIGDRTLAVTPE